MSVNGGRIKMHLARLTSVQCCREQQHKSKYQKPLHFTVSVGVWMNEKHAYMYRYFVEPTRRGFPSFIGHSALMGRGKVARRTG